MPDATHFVRRRPEPGRWRAGRLARPSPGVLLAILSGVLWGCAGEGGDRAGRPAVVADHDITSTILLDPDGTVGSRFRTIGVPETLLIDAEGTIRHRWIGELDPHAPAVRDRVEALLEEARA